MRVVMELVIKVVDVKGKCPVYKLGNKITLKEGYILDPAASDRVCMHSLASILPYYVALAKGRIWAFLKGGQQKRMYNVLILAKSRVEGQCVSRCQESKGDDSDREKEIGTHLLHSISHLVPNSIPAECGLRDVIHILALDQLLANSLSA
jgi:uncharacterized repeat protein (TIGR04076 family)